MNLATRFAEARSDPSRALLEGFHPLKHALRFGAIIESVVVRDRRQALELARSLAPDLSETLRQAEEIAGRAFDALVPRPPATGILALARRTRVDAHAALRADPDAPAVLLDRPAQLGNLGAVVRVAAAAGAAAVVAIGPHDPWSPEAIRGAAGLQFALPVCRCDSLPATGRPLVAVTPEGRPLPQVILPTGSLLAFGSERSGLSPDLARRADLSVSIPMRAGVSSLNLATAVAVLLYRWRLSGPPGAVTRRRHGSS